MMTMPAILAAARPELPVGPFFDASTYAANSDWAFWIITWISFAFFALIVGVMCWFMWKYRRMSHVTETGGPTHNTPLEVTWTIIPLILVIAIFYVGMREYVVMRVPPANAYQLKVTAQKWFWTVRYPNGYEAATPGETIIIPVGVPVKLTMESQDVLHAFFVPAFRAKQDVVPGRYMTLWFEATTPGRYDLICAEYCGKGHSEMFGMIEVLEPDAFEAELLERSKVLDKVPDEQLWWHPKGAPRLYGRCASCHSVDGAASTGPTWKGLWPKLESGEERFTDGSTLAQRIADGTYQSVEDYVLQSIINPNKHIVHGFAGSMPLIRLSERERWALLQYIREVGRDPSRFNKDGTLKPDVLAELQRSAATPTPTPAPAPGNEPGAK